jgi:alkylglycerol monooxygenase
LYYWLHRAGHEVHLLWAAHVPHHSSEDYNLSTALRQSSSGFLFGWIFYLPMALLGIPIKVFIVVGLIDLLYQFWVHTELVGRLGWLDRVFVTPSNHRVHHGQNDYCIDKNYGGMLIVWDRLFGTFADERVGEKIIYGVRKPLRSWNPLWANWMTYQDLCRAAWQAPGWRQKCMVIFAGPGWLGDEAASKGQAVPAFDPNTHERFDTPASFGMQVIAVLGMSLAVALLIYFLIYQQEWVVWHRVGYIGLCVLLLVGLSKLVQRRSTTQHDQQLQQGAVR